MARDVFDILDGTIGANRDLQANYANKGWNPVKMSKTASIEVVRGTGRSMGG